MNSLLLWVPIGIGFILLIFLFILDVAYRSGSKRAEKIIDKYLLNEKGD